LTRPSTFATRRSIGFEMEPEKDVCEEVGKEVDGIRHSERAMESVGKELRLYLGKGWFGWVQRKIRSINMSQRLWGSKNFTPVPCRIG
jgi:hypothetical protein